MKYVVALLAGGLFALAAFLMLGGVKVWAARRKGRGASEPATWGRLSAVNYRGVRLPVVLGLALGAVAFIFLPLKLLQAWQASAAPALGAAPLVANHSTAALASSAWVLVGAALVFVAGLIDDLSGSGSRKPRGLRGHARSLASGRPTTGLLKVVGALGGGVIVVMAMPGRSLVQAILGVLLIAGAANVWNGLDVRPGRAGTWFLLVGVVLSAANPTGLVLYMMGAELGVVYFDVREWAMLGDAGANLLGFVIGVGAYVSLDSTAALAGATAVLVVLNVVAETVSFSRIIERVPPLRWFDRLGRLPAAGTDLSAN